MILTPEQIEDFKTHPRGRMYVQDFLDTMDALVAQPSSHDEEIVRATLRQAAEHLIWTSGRFSCSCGWKASTGNSAMNFDATLEEFREHIRNLPISAILQQVKERE